MDRLHRADRPSVHPDDQFRQHLIEHQVPAAAADLVLSIVAASRAGEFGAVDPTLADLIGRQPLDLAAVLQPIRRHPRLVSPGDGDGQCQSRLMYCSASDPGRDEAVP